MTVVLRPISTAAAEAVPGRPSARGPAGRARIPTEFSTGVAERVGAERTVGPFFIHRLTDEVVVGEIGGGFTGPGVVGIGYAIVEPLRGRGYATAGVRALVARALGMSGIERMFAHTPLDRPASGRVLEKSGFTCVGEADDEHEGVALRVRVWELALRSRAVSAQA